MAGKPIRLGKAAGELNVGLPTLVEFLESKGIKIDSNPNTRLEQEHFELLRQEYAADQSMKEQSKATSRREKRESVTLSDKPADAPKMHESSEDEDEGDRVDGGREPSGDREGRGQFLRRAGALHPRGHHDHLARPPAGHERLEKISDRGACRARHHRDPFRKPGERPLAGGIEEPLALELGEQFP